MKKFIQWTEHSFEDIEKRSKIYSYLEISINSTFLINEFHYFFLNIVLFLFMAFAQSVEPVEYTDCTCAEG